MDKDKNIDIVRDIKHKYIFLAQKEQEKYLVMILLTGIVIVI